MHVPTISQIATVGIAFFAATALAAPVAEPATAGLVQVRAEGTAADLVARTWTKPCKRTFWLLKGNCNAPPKPQCKRTFWLLKGKNSPNCPPNNDNKGDDNGNQYGDGNNGGNDDGNVGGGDDAPYDDNNGGSKGTVTPGGYDNNNNDNSGVYGNDQASKGAYRRQEIVEGEVVAEVAPEDATDDDDENDFDVTVDEADDQ